MPTNNDSIDRLIIKFDELITHITKLNSNMGVLTSGVGSTPVSSFSGADVTRDKSAASNFEPTIKALDRLADIIKSADAEKKEGEKKEGASGSVISKYAIGQAAISSAQTAGAMAGVLADPYMTSYEKKVKGAQAGVESTMGAAGGAMAMGGFASGNIAMGVIGTGLSALSKAISGLIDSLSKEERFARDYTKGKVESVLTSYAEAGIEMDDELLGELSKTYAGIGRQVAQAKSRAAQATDTAYENEGIIIADFAMSKNVSKDSLTKAKRVLGSSGG
jgi:hypothetical protein